MDRQNRIILNSRFSPFLIPLIFGQGYATIDGRLAGCKILAYNIVYLLFILTCYVLNIFTMENKVDYKRYNFISNINFCIQIYITPIAACITIITICRWGHRIHHGIYSQTEIIAELAKIGIPTKHRFLKIMVLTAVSFFTIILSLIVDIVNNGHHFSYAFWISAYIPGTTITIFNIQSISFYKSCDNRFVAVNNYLKSFIQSDMKKLLLSKENIESIGLRRRLPGEQNTVFDKLFELHFRTYKLAQRCNDAIGMPLLLFMASLPGSTLSFMYNRVLNAKREKGLLATDFWTIAFMVQTVMYINIFVTLTKNCNYTKLILHKLLNLYADLQEDGDVYSLQLIHSTVRLTAANYFTLDATIIPKLLLAIFQYLLILIQLKNVQ